MYQGNRCTRRILFVYRHSKTYSLSIYDASVLYRQTQQPRFLFNKNNCHNIQEFLSDETEIKSDMVTRTFSLNLEELTKVKIATCEDELPYQPPLNLPNDDYNRTVSKEEMKRFIKLNDLIKRVMKCTSTFTCDINHGKQ